MTTLEMVEKLRERANVSYDEAKAALDACGGDLLEAMIYLEKQGKVAPPTGGGYYSSQQDEDSQKKRKQKDAAQKQRYEGESFSQLIGRFFRWLRSLVSKGNSNMLDIWRHEEILISLPVTVLVVLILFCFYAVIPLMIVGLFFGCRYRFRGADIEKTIANKVMESAENAADSIKHDIQSHEPKDPQE